jgi:hypothetical protein
MSAAWAAVAISMCMLGAAIIGFIWRAGRRDGKLDTILEHVAELLDDHEDRIRDLEHERTARRPRVR